MEKTPIQQTYEEIIRLNEEQPWSSRIMQTIILLKQIVDQQILDNFVAIYGDHWTETSAYQEFNSQIWLEKLENTLLKKELWIDTSIAKLLLATPSELTNTLNLQKNNTDNISKESEIISKETGRKTEEAKPKEGIKIPSKDFNRFSEEDRLVDKYQWEKEEIIKEITKILDKRFSIQTINELNELNIRYNWDILNYWTLVKLFLWKDYFKKRHNFLNTHMKLSSFIFPEKTKEYLDWIRDFLFNNIKREECLNSEEERESFKIEIDWKHYTYKNLVDLFDAYIKWKHILSDNVYNKLSIKLFWENWERLFELVRNAAKKEEKKNNSLMEDKSIQEEVESSSDNSETGAQESIWNNEGISKPRIFSFPNTYPNKQLSSYMMGNETKYIWPASREDIERIGKQILDDFNEESRKQQSISQLLFKYKHKESENNNYSELNQWVFRSFLLWYINSHEDIKYNILTNKEFYKWDFTTNPVFLKTCNNGNIPIIPWDDSIWNILNGPIYLKTLARILNIPKWDKFRYWSTYENVLIAIFGEEGLKKEREILRSKIRIALEKKFMENPEIEKAWFIDSVRKTITDEWKKTSEYFLVKIDDNYELTPKDISRWIWMPTPEKGCVDFPRLLYTLYWEHETLLRKKKLNEDIKKENYIKENGLIDFWDDKNEWKTRQLSIIFDEWNNEDEELILGDGWISAIDINLILLKTAWVNNIEEFNEKYDYDNEDALRAIFFDALKTIAYEILDNYWDIRDWIEEENKNFIIDSYRKRYPNADKELDNIFNDLSFFEHVKTTYFEGLKDEAIDCFEFMIEDELSVWDNYSIMLRMAADISYYWDLMDLYVDEIQKAFETSHKKNSWTKKIIKEQQVKKTDEEKANDLGITIESYKLIQKFLDSLKLQLTKKKRNRETSKFADMIKNHIPFRLDDFCKQYGIKALPDAARDYLNQLWIYIAFSDKPNKGMITPVSKEVLKQIENTIIEENKNEQEAGIEIIDDDLAGTFMTQAKNHWFWILNEKVLRKQIREYAFVDQNRECLEKSLKNENFWHLNKKKDVKRRKVQMKQKSTIYTIEVQSCAWRFVVQKIEDKFFITDFYKHNDYDNVLKWKK